MALPPFGDPAESSLTKQAPVKQASRRSEEGVSLSCIEGSTKTSAAERGAGPSGTTRAGLCLSDRRGIYRLWRTGKGMTSIPGLVCCDSAKSRTSSRKGTLSLEKLVSALWKAERRFGMVVTASGARGERAAACTCSSVPEEIFLEAGLTPRCMISGDHPSETDPFPRPNTCSCGESLLPSGLLGAASGADVVAFAKRGARKRSLHDRWQQNR